MGRRTRDILLILLGLALVIMGAWQYIRNTQRAIEASVEAQVLLQELKVDIKERQLSPVVTEAPAEQMPQTTLQGVGLIGILQAEEANVQLPVLEKYTEANMDRSPCRYAGSLETGDLVLIGHNYNGHLADLDLLEVGDSVEFIDVDGVIYAFSVAETAVLQPTQVEKLLN